MKLSTFLNEVIGPITIANSATNLGVFKQVIKFSQLVYSSAKLGRNSSKVSDVNIKFKKILVSYH